MNLSPNPKEKYITRPLNQVRFDKPSPNMVGKQCCACPCKMGFLRLKELTDLFKQIYTTTNVTFKVTVIILFIYLVGAGRAGPDI